MAHGALDPTPCPTHGRARDGRIALEYNSRLWASPLRWVGHEVGRFRFDCNRLSIHTSIRWRSNSHASPLCVSEAMQSPGIVPVRAIRRITESDEFEVVQWDAPHKEMVKACLRVVGSPKYTEDKKTFKFDPAAE